jgi:inorganic pyrophosphatase
VTKEALKEMVWPALLALLMPVAVGFGFKYFGAMTGRPQLGVEVIAGFMMFGTLAGLLMAMFMESVTALLAAEKDFRAASHQR